MATAENIVESIPDEVDLFAPLLQQNVIKDDFDQEYLPVNAIQAGAPIEFSIKTADDLYLDLDESRFIVTAKITKANGTDMDDNVRAAPVNLLLHSIFREISATLNDTPVSDPNPLYPYRAYLETLLNYDEEVQKNRMITEGWAKDTAGKMDVTELGGTNIGLKDRATRFATSTVVELVGRPHLDIFHQNRLIPPGSALRIKLIPSSNQFVCISPPPAGNNAQQEQFKVAIQNVSFIIRTKKLSETVHLAILKNLLLKNIRLPYTKVQVKHLTIPANVTSQDFDGIYDGVLPDLVVVGLVADADFAGHYNRNPFNFQAFNVNRMEMLRNGVRTPRYSYTPNFTTKQYAKDYIQFLAQLKLDKGDKCIALTPDEWANGYTLYSFQITDGPIGSGAHSPRSAISTGKMRLSIGFSQANTASIKVILLSQSVGFLDFNQYHNVVAT
jgi:hypothetical protein